MLYCGDSSSDEFKSKLPERVKFAFADPPYNADAAEWDNSFVWNHDYIADRADIVAVTPGISAIFDFSRITKMPYRWSMSTWITNGMTRGALGFGNWIYTCIFSNMESINAVSQDFFKININNSEECETSHKGRKPSEYMAHIIDTFTEPNDVFIDTFLGSGQSLIIAEKSGRKCIGAEISPEFCSDIISRYIANFGRKNVNAL
jgi:DNA modification methylase